MGTGVDFGRGRYAPGVDEDIVVRRTMWERLWDWIVPPDVAAAEERQVVLQIARRLKIKTDLQELRLKKKSEACAKLRPVALVFLSWTNAGKPAEAIILLSRSKGYRHWDLRSMCYKESGIPLPPVSRGHALRYLQSGKRWLTIIDPWMAGVLTDDDLRSLPEDKVRMLAPDRKGRGIK